MIGVMQAMALDELLQLGAAGILVGALAESGSAPNVLFGPNENPVQVLSRRVL
jgi:hypothetical protein